MPIEWRTGEDILQTFWSDVSSIFYGIFNYTLTVRMETTTHRRSRRNWQGRESRFFEVLLQLTYTRMLKEASYTAYPRGIISICLIILDMYARISVKNKLWCLQCVKWCSVKRGYRRNKTCNSLDVMWILIPFPFRIFNYLVCRFVLTGMPNGNIEIILHNGRMCQSAAKSFCNGGWNSHTVNWNSISK